MHIVWLKTISLGLFVSLMGCAATSQQRASPAAVADAKLKALYGRKEGALRQLKDWADTGDPIAQRTLAEIYAHEQDAQSHSLIVEWYRRAAARGDAKAQHQLGSAYQAGRWGLPKDGAAALTWYRAAAAQNNADAEHALGLMEKDGVKGHEDFKAAFRWFQRAAEHGNVEAMFLLGNAYADGQGVDRNSMKAREWYEKAAEAGLPVAIQTLAIAHENGDLGYARDTEKAEELLREAAHQSLH